MKVVASLWEEHCLECAMPLCYGTCGMFERGWHGRCVRVNGFEESVLGTGAISFRRWGKIELMYHGRMMSVSVASRIGRLNRRCHWLWRIFGAYHRAFRWRLIAACGSRGVPKIWRLRMTGERDETLGATIAYEDGREILRVPLPIKAGKEQTFELALPSVEDGALFRIFPLNGEATGRVDIQENLIATDNLTSQPQLKCVVWDLDGVIWDGTLSEGEDVKLRPEVMKTIKALDEAGIVSSICSKNDVGAAMTKLKELGVEEWFVFSQINWGPKSESIKKLASEMNIGLDAIAFVDDREENREEVRTECPGVRVFAETELATVKRFSDGHGDGVASAMGARRRIAYREEMTRRDVAAQTFGGDMAAFIAQSELEVELVALDEAETHARCLELVNRTNQLTITARRYSQEEFTKLMRLCETRAVRVRDKYGDYGIVGFVAWNEVRIVELVFSCRVAMKGVERRVLEMLPKGLAIEVVPTERNAPIRTVIADWQSGRR